MKISFFLTKSIMTKLNFIPIHLKWLQTHMGQEDKTPAVYCVFSSHSHSHWSVYPWFKLVSFEFLSYKSFPEAKIKKEKKEKIVVRNWHTAL